MKFAGRSPQIRQQAEEISQELRDISDSHVGLLTVRPGEGEAANRGAALTYPAQFVAPDEHATLFTNKKALADEVGRQTPGGLVTFGDEDAAMLDRMEKQKQRADFYVWLDQLFDTSDPAIAKWMKKWYPEFVESRVELADKIAELHKILFEIRLKGIQSKEDAFVLYATMTGMIPEWALTTSVNNLDRRPAEQVNYVRGLFNPHRQISSTADTPYANYWQDWRGRLPAEPFVDAPGASGNFALPRGPGLAAPGGILPPARTFPRRIQGL